MEIFFTDVAVLGVPARDLQRDPGLIGSATNRFDVEVLYRDGSQKNPNTKPILDALRLKFPEIDLGQVGRITIHTKDLGEGMVDVQSFLYRSEAATVAA